MKIQPIKFIKSVVTYIKSLGWGKKDVKRILMLIIMLLIACFIVNKFLPVIRVKIIQEKSLFSGDGIEVNIR